VSDYELILRKEAGTIVVSSTSANTQKQAQRRLYRAQGIAEGAAHALGYSVQFKAPTRPIKPVQELPNV
jgi:hypothetical protein